jgi:two-component system OmpR family sensor kinase
VLGSLYSRLALVLLGLFCLVGLVFFALLRLSTEALHDELVQKLNDSLARDIIWAFAASLLLPAVAGLIILKLLTRRLDRLAAAMQAFEANGFAEHTVPPPTVAGGTRDEIGSLARTFSDMAARMVQQVQQLRQTDNMRRELLANVSHDLRTPMASIQGYLETLLLKDGTFTAEERRHHIETALRHSERLSKLIAELFELAKLTREETAIQGESFSLAELVQDVVQKFQLAANSKGIALTASFREDLPFVYADIALIERVLENLIENALRYTPEGGSVRLTLLPGHGTIAVQVSDTGPGIPAESLPQIFDRYYRVEKGLQARGGSAGLGLAIAKRILDLHGRSISVTSELDVGTTFTFELPIAAGLA